MVRMAETPPLQFPGGKCDIYQLPPVHSINIRLTLTEKAKISRQGCIFNQIMHQVTASFTSFSPPLQTTWHLGPTEQRGIEITETEKPVLARMS